MGMFDIDDNTKIGIGLSCIGSACMAMGVCLFFDRTLLALGNVSLFIGLVLLLGVKKACKFFFQLEKWKGSCAYFAGIIAIICGWSFCGFVIEIYGIWKLFASFLPNVLSYGQMLIPGFSTALKVWPLSMITKYIGSNQDEKSAV
eukprot:TRINITY_DN91888_c0_g1_i1.p1 TRINITY_DN91888_c0_g1~~TRINITY_DN91888_c0_g1_i1.p1  ORF type:complete len:145 (+),score=25.15 TRINITY_DN91888_c0_g1_i1:61-495(+)